MVNHNTIRLYYQPSEKLKLRRTVESSPLLYHSQTNYAGVGLVFRIVLKIGALVFAIIALVGLTERQASF